MTVEIKIDPSQWVNLEQRVASAGKNFPLALRRALAHTGKKAKTKMGRALVAQTGLKYRTMTKALKTKSTGDTFEIYSKGGNVRASKVRPKQGKGGVIAHPWNRATAYPGAFTKGGRKHNKPLGKGVLRRTGSGRYPLEQVHTGMYLPTEMVTGSSASTFYATAQSELQARLVHELGFILGKG
jgi:hypothetical protein